jgi:hypothetical protein
MLQRDDCNDSIVTGCHNTQNMVEGVQAVSTVASMPRKKANDPKTDEKAGGQKGDRHKTSYQCRINLAFVEGLKKLAALHGREVPDEVHEAVREYLQKHNLWPKSLGDVRGGTE